MSKIGLVGPSYQSRSLNVDAQACINFYVENMEDQGSKVRRALYSSPGSKVFSALPGMANVREEFYFSGRLFAIADKLTLPSSQQLFEIFSNGTSVNRGTLGVVGSRPSVAANNANQMMIASGGQLFLYHLDTDTIQEIDTTTGAALQGRVLKVGFVDSVFAALLKDSQKFQISAPLDGSSWDPLDIGQVSLYAENVAAAIVDHREIPFFGTKQTVIYGDSGNPLFPYEPIQGAYIEQGIHAVESLTKLDNTLFWIGSDERGGAMAWRLQGYVPTRISNHAIENAWQSYPNSSDAIGYSFQDQGHTFWHLYFPSARKSWRFDVATGFWHEIRFVDGGAHRSQCYARAFDKHLVGDYASGNIYEMSIAYKDDFGNAIRRVRRAPHISDEQKRLLHYQFQLDVETGLGPQPPLLDGKGLPRGPQVMLRWSDDGGHTWSNEQMRDAGQAGQFKQRVIWRRLGLSRDRVYEISVTDPVDWRILEAYVQVEAAQ